KIMKNISEKSKQASAELAKEKGVFPAFEGSLYDDGNPENRVRNVQRTTIAPTGTISMLYDVNSGIEPFFLIGYQKNIRGGDTLKYVVPEFERQAKERGLNLEKILPQIEENGGSVQGIKEVPKDMQEAFRTSHEMSYKDHILMQAAFQKGTDNAVSKTINMKKDATVEDIKNAYKLAWKNGLKGTTIYRDGAKDVQVLEAKKKENKFQIPKGDMENPAEVPEIMPAVGIRQKTPFGNMHIFAKIDPSNYKVVETFGTIGNAGETEAATMEGMGRMTSLWLRSGGKLEKIIEQLEGIGSGQATMSRDGSIESMEQGFSKALTKYLVASKDNMHDFFNGKKNLYEFGEKISDKVRKLGRGWKDYIKKNKEQDKEEKNQKENNNEKKQEERKNNEENKGMKKCPSCKQMTLTNQEGCLKCINPECGYSKCG
ncbi:MAG TPA: hypothetical protein VJ912_03020, partial [Candidatus Nanoarchaeia archaeon]|nr:hypothetical protein [Candidatus Nanoarchaeia archaeon]